MAVMPAAAAFSKVQSSSVLTEGMQLRMRFRRLAAVKDGQALVETTRRLFDIEGDESTEDDEERRAPVLEPASSRGKAS